MNVFGNLDIANLPKFQKKKKYKDFPPEWIRKNGVYVNPKDDRRFYYPVKAVDPLIFEYDNSEYYRATKLIRPWGIDSDRPADGGHQREARLS